MIGKRIREKHKLMVMELVCIIGASAELRDKGIERIREIESEFGISEADYDAMNSEQLHQLEEYAEGASGQTQLRLI